MSDFQTNVEIHREKALKKLRQWSDEDSAKKVMRSYLSEEGLYVKSGSKLDELLEERHKLALTAEDENVKLKAIDSALAMAAGNEKIVATQNNQFNFGDFLNGLKKDE